MRTAATLALHELHDRTARHSTYSSVKEEVEPLPKPTHREAIGVATNQLLAGATLDHSIRRTITDFDNVAACLLAMNTHPMHTDYDFAVQSRFEKPLVVSPFLLSCIVAAVTNDLRQLPIARIEIRSLSFIKPVHPGDTISARSVIESAEPTQYVFAVTGAKTNGTEFVRFRLLVKVDDESREGMSS